MSSLQEDLMQESEGQSAPRERRSKRREDPKDQEADEEQKGDRQSEKLKDGASRQHKDASKGGESTEGDALVEVGSPDKVKGETEKKDSLRYDSKGVPYERHRDGDFEFFKARWGLYKPQNVSGPAWTACLWRSAMCKVRQNQD